MGVLEQLENQRELFQRHAWSAGISRPVGNIRAGAALAFAKKLSRCREVDLAKNRMFEDQEGAQAFWIYSEAAINGMENGSMSTLSDSPPQSHFVELLASVVFIYCRNLMKQYGDDFSLSVE